MHYRLLPENAGEFGAKHCQLRISRGMYEASEFVDWLKGSHVGHHCSDLDALHLIDRVRAVIAAGGFEVDHKVVVVFHVTPLDWICLMG
jgi:hypothetical protein